MIELKSLIFCFWFNLSIREDLEVSGSLCPFPEDLKRQQRCTFLMRNLLSLLFPNCQRKKFLSFMSVSDYSDSPTVTSGNDADVRTSSLNSSISKNNTGIYEGTESKNNINNNNNNNNCIHAKKELKPPLEVPAWSIAIFTILTIGDVAYICYGFYKAFHLTSWWYLMLLIPFSIPNVLIVPLYTKSKRMCFRPIGRFIYTFPFGIVAYFLMNFIMFSPILLFWLIPTTNIDLGQILFAIMIGTTILIYLYSLIVALLPPKEFKYKINLNSKKKSKVKDNEIEEDKNSETHKVTFIHMSDLHWGCSVGQRSARRALKKVYKLAERECKKHRIAVFITGDISDMDNYGFEKKGIVIWREMLEKFDSFDTEEDKRNGVKRVQTFAILGNHDLYDPEDMAELLKPAIVLYNNNNNNNKEDENMKDGYYKLNIEGNKLRLYGINSDTLFEFPKSNRQSLSSDGDQDQIVVREEPFVPKILLEHQPVERPGFDLVLAGHTHGGQLLHFSLPTKIAFPLFIGHYFRKGTHYVVSRGTCWWGPRLRWLRAEVGVVKLSWRTKKDVRVPEDVSADTVTMNDAQ